MSSFGIRTGGGQHSGSGRATLTLRYQRALYQCSLTPKTSGNEQYQTYTCNGVDSFIDDCTSNLDEDELLIENTAGGDALQIDTIYITPNSGSQITIDTDICLSTDGSSDGCPTAYSTVKIDIPSGNLEYGATLQDDCLGSAAKNNPALNWIDEQGQDINHNVTVEIPVAVFWILIVLSMANIACLCIYCWTKRYKLNEQECKYGKVDIDTDNE